MVLGIHPHAIVNESVDSCYVMLCYVAATARPMNLQNIYIEEGGIRLRVPDLTKLPVQTGRRSHNWREVSQLESPRMYQLEKFSLCEKSLKRVCVVGGLTRYPINSGLALA